MGARDGGCVKERRIFETGGCNRRTRKDVCATRTREDPTADRLSVPDAPPMARFLGATLHGGQRDWIVSVNHSPQPHAPRYRIIVCRA